MKEKAGIFILIAIILISITQISAINLEVTAKPISNAYIIDLDKPATFDLTIKNLENDDTFEIYNLIGLNIQPNKSFNLKQSQNKTILIEIVPLEPLKTRKKFFSFEYRIRNSAGEVQKESLVISIINLEDMLAISSKNINPKSESVIFTIENKQNIDLSNVNIKISSAFFDYEVPISLNAKSSKEIIVPLDNDKVKILGAGQYIVNTEITVDDATANLESIIKFLEQADIDTTESSEGIIIRKTNIYKKNLGNIRKDVKITAERNIFSNLFTSTNIPPTTTKITGFSVFYDWKKQLIPNEEINIAITTNWYYPMIIFILLIGLIFLVQKSLSTDLILRKKASFVKTRGGEFALKITLRLKSKKYIEKINVVDKLPPLVNLYHKFGAVPPDKLDHNNRRLEWNIETLGKGEERIYTYIIYSRVGVVGRFELPAARATYEKEGNLKDTTSNRAFYINEPKREE